MIFVFSEAVIADKSDCIDDKSSISEASHQYKHQTKNGKQNHIQSSEKKRDLKTENCGVHSTKNQDFTQTIQSSEETDGFIPLN